MEKEEKKGSSKRSPILVLIMGVIFAYRGLVIFPLYHVHLLVTIFDICALILTGIFLAILTIRKYSKIIILFLGLVWFLPLFPWVWYLISIWYFFHMLRFFGVELLFPLIVFTSLIVSLILWKLMKNMFKTHYYSVYLKRFKLQPETLVALVIVTLIVLATPLPRLSYNSISYNYEGDQEVINNYLQLEINQYFPELEAFLSDTCTGWASFDLVPNYIGATERNIYTNSILSSKYKAKFWMKISATTNDTLLGQEIIQEADNREYRFGFWNNSFQDLYLNDMTFFSNLSQVGGPIYVIREFIRWDNMVGTDMRFQQFVAFFPVNNSIITILSGYEIGCYD
ncbi:MAG: hypothetical protein ACFFCU_18650 [Promethearchaeota archaeon]